MDVADLEFLASPAGGRLLDDLSGVADPDDLGLATRLRRTLPASHVSAALTQTSLRRSAMQKFGADAARMLFTRHGLEQATHSLVAHHRATRAAATAASVVDLGCGVGADSIAFARAGMAVDAVDIDEATAFIARANLAALGLTATVTVGRAEDSAESDADLRFCDPARRVGERRVFDPRAYSPAWSFVERLLAGDAAVKVAPGIDHAVIPDGTEAEWVSLDGALREAVLWSGSLARASRRATALSSGGEPASITATGPSPTPSCGEVGAYVYEPDDAVVRAHLVSDLARDLGCRLLDPHIAYLTSDTLVSSALARAFRVVGVLPFKERALRSALRERGVGPLTIKKRGVDVVPEDLRARLRLTGELPATIIVTRTPAGALSLLVEPIGPGDRDGLAPGGVEARDGDR